MEISPPVVMIIASVVVVAAKFLVGRIKRLLEAVLAAALIICIGLWLLWEEKAANANAEALVETLFNIDPETLPLVFRRLTSRGTSVAQIEAIYELSPHDFNVTSGTSPSLEHISFRYRVSDWRDLTVDRFDVAAGALDWNELPRTIRTADSYRVERGHHSRQRTPNERDMSGRFLCAFIPVDKEADGSVAAYQVLPCSAVQRNRPGGITILGVLNRNDHTLHVLIK